VKKLAAILLLVLMLFNWFGYRLFSSFMEDRFNLQMESLLDDNQYADSQLLLIKMPVTYLPYYNNSLTFERVNGHIEIEGIEYNYVKRRIFNDSLELLCIPNTSVVKLHAAGDELFKFVNDLQNSAQNKNASPRPGTIKSYSLDNYILNEVLNLSAPISNPDNILGQYCGMVNSPHLERLEQPPDRS
jgi:hypothetical protein